MVEGVREVWGVLMVLDYEKKSAWVMVLGVSMSNGSLVKVTTFFFGWMNGWKEDVSRTISLEFLLLLREKGITIEEALGVWVMAGGGMWW